MMVNQPSPAQSLGPISLPSNIVIGLSNHIQRTNQDQVEVLRWFSQK